MLKTRFAPTPSGLLHPGNGLSFILTWCIARAKGGRVLLRIDDLDKGRRRREFLEDIFYTLDWLGLDYDEGPQGVEDFLKNYSQHTRLDLYQEAIDRLRQQGLLYACNCTRRQIRERSSDGRHPGTCRQRRLPFDGSQTAWRVHVPEPSFTEIRTWKAKNRTIDLSTAMGDFVIRQKNKMPAYQIASLIDDLRYGINFIVRGEDLLPSTAAQLFLARQLQADAFGEATFWHHPLLTDTSGEKLSKTRGAGSLLNWRKAGRDPQALYQQAANWLGAERAPVGSLEELRLLAIQLLEAFPAGGDPE